MRNLIDSVDVPTRQVVIEARIVETTKIFAQQYGFNWGFHGAMDPSLGTGTGLVFPNRIDTVGGPFDFGAGNPVLSLHARERPRHVQRSTWRCSPRRTKVSPRSSPRRAS